MKNDERFFGKKFPLVTIKVLAVADPAVVLYAHGNGVTEIWEAETGATVQFDPIPWSEYPGKLFGMLQAGFGEYDIIMAPGFFWLPKFASSSWISSFDDLLEKNSTLWHAYDYDDIHPGLRYELEYNHKHYLFPCFSEVQIVYFQRELCAKAGFTNLPIPISADNYLSIASALHAPPNTFGTQIKASLAESFPEWLPWLSEYGGTLFDNEKNPVFQSSAGRQALEYMLKLSQFCAPGMDISDNEQILHLMHQGKIGITNHWSGQIGPILDKKDNPTAKEIGFTHLQIPWGSIWSFGINAASKNKEEAFSYLCWATNAQHDKEQLKYSGSPVRLSTFRNVQLHSDFPWLPILESAIQSRKSFPSFVKFVDALEPLYEMVNLVMTGNKTSQDALDAAAEACQKTFSKG